MAADEDVTPVLEQKPRKLTVVVRDHAGREMEFKVKTSTVLSRVFDVWCEHNSRHFDSCRFMLDNSRILATQTPGDLDLDDDEDRVVIDVWMEQSGG